MEFMWLCTSYANSVATRELMDARPGGVVRVDNPSNYQRMLPQLQAPRHADCEGCGAPLKSYTHHCEYCRRAI